jgi:hypothetical protein
MKLASLGPGSSQTSGAPKQKARKCITSKYKNFPSQHISKKSGAALKNPGPWVGSREVVKISVNLERIFLVVEPGRLELPASTMRMLRSCQVSYGPLVGL